MSEEHEADTINWNLTISLSAWWEPTLWFWNLSKLHYNTLSLETQKEESTEQALCLKKLDGTEGFKAQETK